MDRIGWADTVRKAPLWQKAKPRRDGLWKSREVEKSKSRLSHLAWKSRKNAGLPLSHSHDYYGRLTKIEHSLFYEKGTFLMSFDSIMRNGLTSSAEADKVAPVRQQGVSYPRQGKYPTCFRFQATPLPS